MKNIKKLTAFFVLSFLCLIYVNCAGKSSSFAEGGGTTGGLATCSYTAAAKGSRQFGMDILDEAATGGYNGNVAKLKQLKGTYQTLHLTWTAIETTAGSGTTSGTLVDPFSPGDIQWLCLERWNQIVADHSTHRYHRQNGSERSGRAGFQ